MANQPKIYLETTLFNYYLLNDPSRQSDIEATKKLFDEIAKGQFEGFVSPETIREIGNSPDSQKKSRMIEIIKNEKLNILQPGDFIGFEELTEQYIKAGAIPPTKMADARHIAIATSSHMDILASWNQRHIVRYKTQSIIQSVNIERGLSQLSINTPSEIITYE